MSELNKIYKKASLRAITTNLTYFIISLIFVTIFITLQSGNFITSLIFSFGAILFIEFFIILIKVILYNGQYGVSVEIDKTIIKMRSNRINISDITQIARYTIRYYGDQINIEDKLGNKIKFFSPEATLFESDLVGILKQNNKQIETKAQSFPNSGIIYNINS